MSIRPRRGGSQPPGRSRPPAPAVLPALVRVVVAALVGTLLPAVPAAPALAGDDYRDAVDLTFPVRGDTTYQDDFHAPRGGGTRVHQATDIMADYGQPVHAAMGGRIGWITGLDGRPPSYGYMISIDGDDGRRYSYIHLGRQDRGPSEAYVSGLRDGDRVERGDHIGWVGCSGNASCAWPHLHFAIEDTGVRDPYGDPKRNPYRSLVAAEARGDLPGVEPPAVVDPCAPTGPVPDAPLPRIGGEDPVGTSVAVSRAGWTSAAEALVATAGDFADALAGAALAADRGAPLLLVGDRLADATADELRRLGVGRVTILGGDAAVAPAVAQGLAATVGRVDRLSGVDRFATAAAIHDTLGQPTDEIVLALGRHTVPGRSWPDAIAAGAFAAADAPLPVVLTEDDRLPDATRQRLLAARDDGATRVLVIGGTAAIAAAVDDVVAGLGLEVRRLQGPTRYETSVAVASAAEERGAAGRALVAVSGASPTDALPGGPLAARVGGTLLLVPPCSLDRAPLLASFVDGRYGDGYVIGAPSAVSERVREGLTDAIAD